MKIKNEKAITLIALIITIILMLILAGVVITLTIGENGLFKTAKYATKKWNNATIDEKRQINELYNQIENKIGNERVYLYNKGNEYQENSGGWTEKILQYNPKFLKENNYLYVDSKENGSAGYFQTENEIDFSKYSKLVVRWSKCKVSEDAHFTVLAGIWESRIWRSAHKTHG